MVEACDVAPAKLVVVEGVFVVDEGRPRPKRLHSRFDHTIDVLLDQADLLCILRMNIAV